MRDSTVALSGPISVDQARPNLLVEVHMLLQRRNDRPWPPVDQEPVMGRLFSSRNQ